MAIRVRLENMVNGMKIERSFISFPVFADGDVGVSYFHPFDTLEALRGHFGKI